MRLFAFVLIYFTACSDNATPVRTDATGTPGSEAVHSNATETRPVGGKPLVLNGCYEMIMKQDTASLTLNVKDTTVTGQLDYRWYEKDRNEGTLKGVLRNDKIYADYTFNSEGMTSVREVVFKIQDATLLQGTGELTEANGKIIYRDANNLSYDTTNPFIKVACNKASH